MKTLKGKIFLSDEGYGHIVRQRAIIEALRSLHSDFDLTVQTHRHLEAASRLITDVKTIDKYNNITWHKKANGSPDVDKIHVEYARYLEQSEEYIKDELEEWDYDFAISDFVYEAFPITQKNNKPSFGIAHFTWDWFFSKLYPPPLKTQVVYRFFEMAKMADALYFPPFTPEEILHYYSDNAQEVPLILRGEINHKKVEDSGKFKILIIDSGAGVLRPSILKALDHIRSLDDYQFFVSSNLEREQDNLSFIDKNELMVDYINEMDLVIARAGFNTISECIGLRTPMLLLGEAMNPEMNENIINLKKGGLATFIGLDTFENSLDTFLPHFIDHEYKSILQNMQNHEMATNGAEVIARDILDRIL
ncbi:glycosyltransferase [Sanyastnella coralliicola]|uniref:glycosyltransferase n=1 Tax=Sanyastnella coralliicola TaxID=3069118 RepID=UPI0027BAA9B8|nr:glycosyltransferase [Longitalea sp. SCSIO 12813]